jgi:NTE family protein
MQRTGLVLGAGGSLGWAYHLGVLDGIREAIGLQIQDAERVIGTSAGAAIGASALTGASSQQILESIVAPVSPEDRKRMEAARDERRWTRFFRPQAPAMIRRGGLAGLVGLLPAGVFPTTTLRRFPASHLDRWPESLWLPAVRLGDGGVVVFGRDRSDVAVIDAVEATSAVPALFQPKTFGRDRFVDGAVASSTHADLLLADPPNLVIVSSPMTRPGRGPVRLRARWQLRREVAALRSAGSQVVVVTPDERLMALAEGYPRQRPDAGPGIVAEAKRQTEMALAEL